MVDIPLRVMPTLWTHVVFIVSYPFSEIDYNTMLETRHDYWDSPATSLSVVGSLAWLFVRNASKHESRVLEEKWKTTFVLLPYHLVNKSAYNFERRIEYFASSLFAMMFEEQDCMGRPESKWIN